MSFDLSKFLDENGGITADKVKTLEAEIETLVKKGIEEATAGILKNKNELLEEKKNMQKKLTETVEELEKLRKTGGGTQEDDKKIEEIKKVIENQFKPQIEKLEKELGVYKEKLETSMVSENILKTFDKINITDPIYREDLLEIFKSKAKVINDMVTIEEKPIDTYLQEWSSTDRGKRYIADPGNIGGGSDKANPGGTSKQEISTQEWLEKKGVKN